MSNSGYRDRCYFVVGTGHKAHPVTYRGLLRARLEAKKLVRNGELGDAYSVRLVCGPGGKRTHESSVETCKRRDGRAVCESRGLAGRRR